MVVAFEEVVSFWLETCSPEDWYKSEAAFDAEIKERFEPTWEAACAGRLGSWMTQPRGALGFIILTDQFSRNMYRGTGKAFSSDAIALRAAKFAVNRGWDLSIEEPARQFYYMPLMHSENLCDQERCIRLMKEHMPETGTGNLLHAKAHREVIRRFGRFPNRNDALKRRYTAGEQAYIEGGGYGSTVRALQAAAR